MTTERAINPDLMNRKAFVQKNETFGIPTSIFFGAVMLTGFGAFAMISYMGWYVGSVLAFIQALVILIPVFIIHEDDPDGWLVWIRAILAADRLDPGRVIRKKLLIVREGSSGKTLVSLSKIKRGTHCEEYK